MAIERRSHLFPSRTQKLSFSSSKILGWRRPGKIEHCWLIIEVGAWAYFFVFILINFVHIKQCSSTLTRAPHNMWHFPGAVGPRKKARASKHAWACETERVSVRVSNEHCWLASQTALHFNFCLTPKVLAFVCLFRLATKRNRTHVHSLAICRYFKWFWLQNKYNLIHVEF